MTKRINNFSYGIMILVIGEDSLFCLKNKTMGKLIQLVNKPEFDPNYVRKILTKFPMSHLDRYSEEWLAADKPTNPNETPKEFQIRKDFMVVLLMNEKLNRYAAGE